MRMNFPGRAKPHRLGQLGERTVPQRQAYPELISTKERNHTS